ncbi:MAG: oxidoreductase [Parcubacteria group bacterium]|nr:oxidoreductase [Parcubacteria group bacterium]
MNQNQTHSEQPSALTIPLAIVVAGLLIAGAIYFGGSKSPNMAVTNPNGTQNAENVDVPAVSDKDHILGDKNAAVVLVEYSDFECPFCKVFNTTVHRLMDTYGSKLAVVYRQFPIAQLHSKAPKEAEASECAAEQGGNTAFFKFADKVFETTNSNDSLDPAQLPIIAGQIGLDVAKFNSCLSSGKYTNKIAADVAAAAKAGAQGTPYSILITKDGKKATVSGAQPFEVVKAQIDGLLK